MFNFPDLDLGAAAVLGGMASVIFLIGMVIALFALAFGIVSYIFTGLGVYTIANRRGIRHAWLAWIPVANAWVMGCISDQYQQAAKGRNTRRRVTLLVLMIVNHVASAFSSAVSVEEMMNLLIHGDYAVGGAAMMSSTISLITSGISIAYSVMYYFCLYDLYTSCKPESNVLYLVLSILLGVTTPFLIFSCRNKDLGMPPRQPQYQPPYQPQMYGQQPEVPTWQSFQRPQPDQAPRQPAEPWERHDQQ